MFTHQPIDHPYHIDRRSRGDMLEVGPRQPDVARVPHIHAPYPLGDGSFNPRPFAIQRFEFFRRLPVPCAFLGLILRLRIDRQGTANVLRTRASLAQGTPPTVLHAKGKQYVRRSPGSRPFRIVRTRAPAWTPRLFRVPIDGEVGVVERILRPGLPTLVRGYGANQIDTVLLTRDEEIRFHVAFVDQMDLRQQVAF